MTINLFLKKSMPKLFTFLFAIFLSLIGLQSLAQDKIVTKTEVEEIKKEEAYWYADLPITQKVNTPTEKRSLKIPQIVGELIKWLMWLIVGIAIVAMLYYLLRNLDFNWNKTTENTEINPTQEISSEKELRGLNYAQLVKEASEKKDYRMAIRWYYLWILKELSEKDKIVFDKFKTNNEYKQKLKEVLGINHKYLPLFAKVLKYYEYVWFGQFAIKDEQFTEIEADFKKAIATI